MVCGASVILKPGQIVVRERRERTDRDRFRQHKRANDAELQSAKDDHRRVAIAKNDIEWQLKRDIVEIEKRHKFKLTQKDADHAEIVNKLQKALEQAEARSRREVENVKKTHDNTVEKLRTS
ncbi:hypothetical protein LTR09_007625 [Extremus antarcticus]|uniref:Uncharacterized protein n=1 Tax=Extremus antarcticus TaxID=702011 RepID=A0AAJ0DJQ2_9PEZI|nr:hypothetical protein LTR09_007625 [Extremus antarcticus]